MKGDRHHIIPKQALKSAHRTWTREAQLSGQPVVDLRTLLDDPRNIMRVKPVKHQNHEFGPRGRLTRAELPDSVYEFAEQYGLMNEIDRRYPADA